jgi:2-oxoglutarate ferredoxin oxidoreductase subunit beta
MSGDFITGARNTWCPGCGNFALQHSLKTILEEYRAEGKSTDEIVLVNGIGCHGKMGDYMGVNSVYSLHGRAIPVATGLKIANPNLTVICCVGDGDTLAEGLAHLIFAAKRNVDISVFVHNNRVFGLTTGQYTPTSPESYHRKSNPQVHEHPLNPPKLMLDCGATYVGRGYSRRMSLLKDLMKGAMEHRGFAFVDILQICASFMNLREEYDQRVIEIKDTDRSDFQAATTLAEMFSYNNEDKIPLGLFYQKARPSFDEQFTSPEISHEERIEAIHAYIKARS